MTDKVDSTCASCGARLEDSSEKCPLCGWTVGTEDHDLRISDKKDEASEFHSPAAESNTEANENSSVVFCHNCGAKNPFEANFCSACGTKLHKPEQAATVKSITVKKAELPSELKNEVEAKADKEDEVEPIENEEPVSSRTSGMQVGMLITASLLIVTALYMITVFSKRAFPDSEAAPQQQAEAATQQPPSEAAPLSSELEAQVASLMSEAEALTGDAQVSKKREAVNVLMAAQRFDRAAPVQEEIAEATGQAADWFQAGHFYYDWMDQLSGPQRPLAAQSAVGAYEQGLSINPDDLVVRTALAMAYLNTNTPMLGITQIRQVLDEDPDHLEGNFYFGVMLMQINRIEQAKERFERVKELVGPESQMYQQADIMLNNIAALTG